MHSSVEKEAGDEPTGTNIKIRYGIWMRQDIYRDALKGGTQVL